MTCAAATAKRHLADQRHDAVWHDWTADGFPITSSRIRWIPAASSASDHVLACLADQPLIAPIITPLTKYPCRNG